MEIVVKRKQFTDQSTIGEMFINGLPFCYTLEDKDRDLIKSQPITDIAQRKLFGVTAIPYGKYDLAMTYSNRFQKYMPQILNVPCFEGVRIHTGNRAQDSEGCVLVGDMKGLNEITGSRNAFANLMRILKAVEKKEKITIQIVK